MNQNTSIAPTAPQVVSDQRLLTLNIKQLKNLIDVELPLSKTPLTAIMGPNCSGKTTVLHALACVYQPPQSDSPNYKFPQFFKPNTDSLWAGSNFSLAYAQRIGPTEYPLVQQQYTKLDRWTPRYEKRPIRHTRLVTMKESLPEVETFTLNAMVHYRKAARTSELDRQIREAAGQVLNRTYDVYHSVHYQYGGRQSIGVTVGNLTYPALTMSSGEQRIFRILSAVYSAPKYALLLIDEIDLFLHQDALTRLLHVLDSHCKNKNKQLIFTTHFPPVAKMYQDISILTLYRAPEKTVIWSGYSYPAMQYITGQQEKPLSIFVEDDVARAIIAKAAADLRVRKHLEIGEYGPAANAYTLGAGLVLSNKNLENLLVVLDGDVLSTRQEKNEHINKALTGTAPSHQQKRKALSALMTRLWQKDSHPPEKTLHQFIKSLPSDILNEEEKDIFEITRSIDNVTNTHGFIDKIVDDMGESREVALTKIVALASKSHAWPKYTRLVRTWLARRKKALSL